MYIKVTVTPAAKKENVEQIDADRYAISVREPAARNLANRRVRELVAALYAVSVEHVRIITGHRSPNKVISIDI